MTNYDTHAIACYRRSVSKQRRDNTGRTTGNKARKKEEDWEEWRESSLPVRLAVLSRRFTNWTPGTGYFCNEDRPSLSHNLCYFLLVTIYHSLLTLHRSVKANLTMIWIRRATSNFDIRSSCKVYPSFVVKDIYSIDAFCVEVYRHIQESSNMSLTFN